MIASSYPVSHIFFYLPNILYWCSLQIRPMSIHWLKSVATKKMSDTKLFSTWQASCSCFVSFTLSFEVSLMSQIIERITFLRSQNWQREKKRAGKRILNLNLFLVKDVTVVKIVSLNWYGEPKIKRMRKKPLLYMSAWVSY